MTDQTIVTPAAYEAARAEVAELRELVTEAREAEANARQTIANLREERDEARADLMEARGKLATAQGILTNAAVERQEVGVLLGAIEVALQEYPRIPKETFIGREDLAARVTWLARRASMLERSDASKWKALAGALEVDLERERARVADLELLVRTLSGGGDGG